MVFLYTRIVCAHLVVLLWWLIAAEPGFAHVLLQRRQLHAAGLHECTGEAPGQLVWYKVHHLPW